MIPASAPGGSSVATRAYTDASILLHRGDSADLIVVSISELRPVLTGTYPVIGDVDYRSLPGGADTLLAFSKGVPQSWPSCTVSMIVAKNFNAEGTVNLTSSTLSDASNQLSSGDSVATAAAHMSTTWLVPVGSSTPIQHTFIEVAVATIQTFETPTPTMCNFIVGRLGLTGVETFGNHAIALAGVTLRRSVP